MKEIIKLISEALEDEKALATVTLDRLKEIRRDANNGGLDEDSCELWAYEIELVVEVMDQQKFPKDYAILSKLLELLEEGMGDGWI